MSNIHTAEFTATKAAIALLRRNGIKLKYHDERGERSKKDNKEGNGRAGADGGERRGGKERHTAGEEEKDEELCDDW